MSQNNTQLQKNDLYALFFPTEFWWCGVPYDTCHTCICFSIQQNYGVEYFLILSHLYVLFFLTELWWCGVPYDTYHTCVCFSFQQNYDDVEYLMISITPICVFLSNKIMVAWSTVRYLSHLHVFFFPTELWWCGVPHDTYRVFIAERILGAGRKQMTHGVKICRTERWCLAYLEPPVWYQRWTAYHGHGVW